MMKTTQAIWFATLSSILFSTASAERIKRLEDSWYIGGSIGYSSLEPSTPTGAEVTDSKSMSIKAYGGVNISNQIGIEAFWIDLGDSSVKGVAGNGKINYSAVGVNGIYHLPAYAGRVHPFGKLGVAKINTKSTGVAIQQKNNFAIFGGVGAEYDVNDHLKVRAEYDYFTEDVSQFNVGLNWAPNPRVHYLDNRQTKSTKSAIPAALPFNLDQPKKRPMKLPAVPKNTQRKPVKIHTLNSSLSGASLFSTGSARLTYQGINRLNHLINKVNKRDFKLYHITISGHTDNRGSHKRNIALSKKRADAVARYMSSRGIQRNHMSVVGYGESHPIANNSTSYGRAKNRRVDIGIKGAQTIVASSR